MNIFKVNSKNKNADFSSPTVFVIGFLGCFLSWFLKTQRRNDGGDIDDDPVDFFIVAKSPVSVGGRSHSPQMTMNSWWWWWWWWWWCQCSYQKLLLTTRTILTLTCSFLNINLFFFRHLKTRVNVCLIIFFWKKQQKNTFDAVEKKIVKNPRQNWRLHGAPIFWVSGRSVGTHSDSSSSSMSEDDEGVLESKLSSRTMRVLVKKPCFFSNSFL